MDPGFPVLDHSQQAHLPDSSGGEKAPRVEGQGNEGIEVALGVEGLTLHFTDRGVC